MGAVEPIRHERVVAVGTDASRAPSVHDAARLEA
jgi:hypothetical protein